MRSVHGIKAEPPATVFIALKTEGIEPFEELVKTTNTDHKSKQCPYCRKLLANTKEHIKAVHLKEKNYFCQQCDYKTLFKSDLLKHDELVHRKIKKSCPHCGKQVANLHEHIRLGKTMLYIQNIKIYLKPSFGRRDHDFRTPRPDFLQNETVKINFR